jgi:hypothetical protein
MAARAQVGDTDAFQRYFIFKNDLDHPVYPVIQAPNDSNCNQSGFPGGSVLRIVINSTQAVAGIPPGGKVRVAIPKDQPCAKGGFYDAARIYVLLADVLNFENTFPANDDKRTTPIDISKWRIDLCSDPDTQQPLPGACWVGLAKADYGHDAPGQLLEYTIISQNPDTGDKFPDSQGGANNKDGLPFLDFDVSYVDDAHLPIAMAISDGGATQFMGSLIAKPVVPDSYNTFKDRLSSFIAATQWSRYAAYTEQNWNAHRTTFQDLVPDRIDRLPSANILITDSRTGGLSNFYTPVSDGQYSRLCNAGDFNNLSTPNRQCHVQLPTVTNCCPDDNNVFQSCCDVKAYLIEDTLGAYAGRNEKKLELDKVSYTNATLTDITARWHFWVQPSSVGICSTPQQLPAAPVLDQKDFCTAFDKTVDYVWQQFKTTDAATTRVCASIQDPEKNEQCLVQQIIGYDIKSGYDPKKCGECPTNCPSACVQEIQRNESVQALQRGLPWTPAIDDSKCNDCPGEACAKECVAPAVATSKKLYHRSKFLHFWADYTSPYNLNPFARFVHNREDGLAAPGAYSFSIDDFYGNFGGQGSTLLIDIGGTTELPNKEPFDPFKQYAVGVAPGWYRGTVCGRPFSVPNIIRGKKGLSVPFSFWKDGQPLDSCEIVLYDKVDRYVKFLLKEVTYEVTDIHTGHRETVSGLSGVWANRPSTPIAQDDPYCAANASRQLVSAGKCKANLSAKGGNQDYVSVLFDGCTDANNAACGKPMVVLNPPATN